MTKKDRKELGMAEESGSVINEDKFLNSILKLFKDLHDNGVYNSNFMPEVVVSYMDGFNLSEEAPNSYENLKKLCGTPTKYGANKIIYFGQSDKIRSNADFIKEMVKEYVIMHEVNEQPRYAGRLFWNLLTKCSLDNDLNKGSSQSVFYKKHDRFEKDKADILSCFANKMSVEDRIKALDWFFSYKKTDRSGVYGFLIGKLAYYDIGETKENREWVVSNTIKLLNQVYSKAKSSKSNDFVELALPILENAAINSYYLQGKTFFDSEGKLGIKNAVYDFGDNVREYISRRLKESGLRYSEDLALFLEGQNTPTDILIKKMSIVNKSIFGERKISADEVNRYNAKAKLIFAQLEDGNIVPNNKLVRTYAEYLCQYAKINSSCKNIDSRLLEKLVSENANYMELNMEVGVLFDDATPKKRKRNVNKELVKDIAQIYASSVLTTDDVSGDFNLNFHNSMTKMFSDIVVKNNYTKKDVDALCGILEKGGNHAPEFVAMCRSVKYSYNLMLSSRAKAKKIF
ncbi:MAG: hypothetical protein E7019_04740 [Alphaproteobacteria bacterium]|nr:hypothetical protein [Alphaproteobacteria bacterium]